MPSRCPNSRLIVANIVSRSGRLLTSARMARLPTPSVSLAACSDPSFKPQMATRAPSRSNSCAAASPIPLLPPVMRMFLSVSLPIVVTPLDRTCVCPSAHLDVSKHLNDSEKIRYSATSVRELGLIEEIPEGCYEHSEPDDTSHSVEPKCSLAAARTAKSSMPRLTELRTRPDGLFAQICNNR